MEELSDLNTDNKYGYNIYDYQELLKKLHPEFKWRINFLDYEDKCYYSLAVKEDDAYEAQRIIDNLDLKDFTLTLTKGEANKLIKLIEKFQLVFEELIQQNQFDVSVYSGLSETLNNLFNFLDEGNHQTLIKAIDVQHQNDIYSRLKKNIPLNFQNYFEIEIKDNEKLLIEKNIVDDLFYLDAMMKKISLAINKKSIITARIILNRYYNASLVLKTVYYLNNFLLEYRLVQ